MRIKLPIEMTVGELRRAVGASGTEDPRPIHFLSTDTRSLLPGDLFWALHGERDDGHRYLMAAQDAKAAAILSESDIPGQLRVKNTHAALLALAGYTLKKRRIPVVAVTGSVGKTGAKDAVAAALSPHFTVHKTSENENNEIGVAKTVLSRPQSATLLVIEMGTNHKGEIAPLSLAVRPDLAIITAIGSAHIGAFGSKEAILEEKAHITDGMAGEGKLLLSANDPLLAGYRQHSAEYIGIDTPADFMARGIFSSRFGTSYTLLHAGTERRIFLHGAGRPRVFSSLFALAAATHFGVPHTAAAGALLQMTHAAGRGSIHEVGGILLIDDAYNSSPEAVAEGLGLLSSVAAGRRRIAVLGDMLELGKDADKHHREIGRLAARHSDAVFAFGKLADKVAAGAQDAKMASEHIKIFENAEDCALGLIPLLSDGDAVLVKASNALGGDRIVAAIRALDGSTPE